MAKESTIRFRCFPQTHPPKAFVKQPVEVFRAHEATISTVQSAKGLTSDGVLAVLRADLVAIGFDVEAGKQKSQKITRPVFFGDNGEPTLVYEVDAYHIEWKCGLEVEAGRGFMGNAFYRDLIQAMVMVEVDTLIVAVANNYKYKSSGRQVISNDYDNAIGVAEALYGHSRVQIPYSLVVIGY